VPPLELPARIAVSDRRLLRRGSVSPSTALAAVAPALIVGFVTGSMPPSLAAYTFLYERPNAVAQLSRAADVIPADAPVNADAGLCVWLANRHTINDFPDMLDGGAYVVVDQDYYLGNNTNRAKRQAAADALATGGRRLIYDDGRFQVWSPVGD